MLEKDIENLIALHPKEFFPKSEFTLDGQQVNLYGRYADIVFVDKFGRTVIIEVKKGALTREAAGQIMEYYGLMKQAHHEKIIELILCANNIPAERRSFLETAGIECKEISLNHLLKVAEKYNYKFIDEATNNGIAQMAQKAKAGSQDNDTNALENQKEETSAPSESFEIGGYTYSGKYGKPPYDTRVLKKKFNDGNFSDKRTLFIYAVLTNLQNEKILLVESIVKKDGYIADSLIQKVNGYLKMNNVPFEVKSLATATTKKGMTDKGITKVVIEKC